MFKRLENKTGEKRSEEIWRYESEGDWGEKWIVVKAIIKRKKGQGTSVLNDNKGLKRISGIDALSCSLRPPGILTENCSILFIKNLIARPNHKVSCYTTENLLRLSRKNAQLKCWL